MQLECVVVSQNLSMQFLKKNRIVGCQLTQLCNRDAAADVVVDCFDVAGPRHIVEATDLAEMIAVVEQVSKVHVLHFCVCLVNFAEARENHVHGFCGFSLSKNEFIRFSVEDAHAKNDFLDHDFVGLSCFDREWLSS